MAAAPAHRTTRLTAIGRFREERLARRAADLEERMSMIQDVAARVLELVDDTQEHMSNLRSTRRIAADDLHTALDAFRTKLMESSASNMRALKTDRQQNSLELHASLDQFRADLTDTVHQFLSTSLKTRAENAKVLHDALDAFLITLGEQGDAGRAQACKDCADRLAFLDHLRDDVVRLVTDDFR